MTIFKRRACVVTSTGRIGRVDSTFIHKGKRWHSVQFGADGPFEDIRADKLRAATEREEEFLDGVRTTL